MLKNKVAPFGRINYIASLRLGLLKQKQVGIILITLGGFLFAFIFLFLYFNVIRVPGFSELLPAKETVGFVEFPVALENPFIKKMNEMLGLEWNKDIAPWAGEKAVLAFLKNPDRESQKLFSFLLIQTRSLNDAFLFLKNFKNPQKEIREVKLSGVTAFSTPQLHFAFLSDVLVVAPTAKSLTEFLAYQSSSTQHLGSDSDFIQIHANVSGPFFVYAKPREVPTQVFSIIASNIPSMPILTNAFGVVGIAAEKTGGVWRGNSYAIRIAPSGRINSLASLRLGLFEKSLPAETPQPYRAALLPFLPAETDFLISGQNLFGQMKKIDGNLGARDDLPKLSAMIKRLAAEYLPGIDIEKNLAPLFEKEFALTVSSDRFLFLIEASDPSAPEKIAMLRGAFQKTNGRLTPKAREVILPDGTKAAELIADSSKVKLFEEIFGGVAVRGFLFGKNGAVYDAFSQGIWFISNDFETIKKALRATKEPANSLRESQLYKESLQPILKNPELLGLAVLPQGIFSFSKRTAPDHMETNFMWRER